MAATDNSIGGFAFIRVARDGDERGGFPGLSQRAALDERAGIDSSELKLLGLRGAEFSVIAGRNVASAAAGYLLYDALLQIVNKSKVAVVHRGVSLAARYWVRSVDPIEIGVSEAYAGRKIVDSYDAAGAADAWAAFRVTLYGAAD